MKAIIELLESVFDMFVEAKEAEWKLKHEDPAAWRQLYGQHESVEDLL